MSTPEPPFSDSTPVRLSQTSNPAEVELELFKSSLLNGWLLLYLNLSVALLIGVMQITTGDDLAAALAGFVARCGASMIASAILLPIALMGSDWMRRRPGRCRAALVLQDAVILGATGLSALPYVSAPAYAPNAQLVVSLGASAAISAVLAPRLPAALPLGRLLAFLPVAIWIVVAKPPLWGALLGLAAFSYAMSVAIAIWVYLQSLRAADVAVRLRAAHAETQRLAGQLMVSLETERDSRARIETESRLRERFVHAVTHDLRQSLSALRLHSLAFGRNADDPRTQSHTQVTLDCLSSADATIESVAQAAWLAEEATDLSVRTLRLDEVLPRLCQEVQPLIRQAGMTLTLVPTRLAVAADRNYLDRVLRNLVHNTLRHAKGRRVLIGARPRGDRVEIIVADDGQGIPTEKQRKVFERFYQGADPGARPVGSVGLGLAIVKEMTERMGGTVRLSSRPGHGALFALSLARADAAPARASIPLTGRVLVLDDDPSSLSALALAVQQTGCTALSCGTLDEALQSGPAAATICDFHLAEGATAFDLLDRMTPAEQARTLIVSTNLMAPMAAKVRALGCDVAVKPVAPERIQGFLSAALAPS